MGVVKKVVKYSIGMAIVGFALYEVSKMMSRKAGTRPGEMHVASIESRDPRDYRSIYDL